jgi:V/A-type H+/Na+-transporting ATPase subunit D
VSEITPTRSALLELQEERRAMREGYAFLDEKRLLLAAEMLRQLGRYEQLQADLLKVHQAAAHALQAAVARHGLQGLECYPAASLDQARLAFTRNALLGVPLQQAELQFADGRAALAANPSPEAEHCRSLFSELIRQAAALAAVCGNLERLRLEYRRTERRARALEDVLLPEIEQTLAQLDMSLEDAEREEALRGRSYAPG